MQKAQPKIEPTSPFAQTSLPRRRGLWLHLASPAVFSGGVAGAALHAEQFYGFIGLALVWQFVFAMIARDAHRYRALMLVAVLEKLAFGIPAWMLYLQGRAAPEVVIVGSIDLLLGTLFAISFFKVRAGLAEQKA